jgi:hypothetical protein
MVILFYYGYGDSLGFYQGGVFVKTILANTGDPFSTFFMNGDEFTKLLTTLPDQDISLPVGIAAESNLIVMKISALFSYFSFNSYLITSLFFGLFSFFGLWKLFCVMNEVSQKKAERLLAYAVLYTPSIWFWGSGLMKDSICIGAIGLIVYYLHKIFIKRKFKITDPVLLIFLIYLLYSIKSYLAIVLLLSIAMAYVLNLVIISKKSPLRMIAVVFILFVSATIILVSASSTITSIMDDSQKNTETFQKAYEHSDIDDERSKGSFAGTTSSNSLSEIILKSPIAIVTTLYRPFVWETQKPIMLFSALESLLSLLATIYVLIKCRIWKFFSHILNDPYLFTCFSFTVVLGIIIGFSTFNFGTLVRYRLPVLPFFFFGLIYIYIKNKEATLKLS